MKAWLNGELVDDAAALVPITDKGFLVGDGVFETLRAYEGAAFALREHVERLAHSAGVMGIELPALAELEAAVEATVAANELSEARVRVTVTSGDGPAGLGRGEGRPTALVTATPLPDWPATARAVISPWPRNERSVLAGVKTTSNAENIVKLAHARREGADEAISVNLAGNLCEGTSSNVFIVRGTHVSTPSLDAGCLAGITRDHVLALDAVAPLEIAEENVSASELRDADELFLTSSTRELQPLVKLDGHAIGDGEPGPITRRLAAAFSEMVREKLRG
ncbi:MAG: aminotransferase class IV [Solirubrobacterales bacterium]